MNSQKIIIIQNKAKLSANDGMLIIDDEEKQESIAFTSIESLIISNNKISLSTYLLNELVENSVKVIFCDKKHKPFSIVIPLHGNVQSPLMVYKQYKWTKRKKDELWKKIVELKINNSIFTLKNNNIKVDKLLNKYLKDVKLADKTNREALAARLCFICLYGKDFNRESDSVINSYLNYGYSIIASHISNTLVSMGYNTEIGIHHCNEYNMLNLTYDFIEPVRFFVDNLVYSLKNEKELNKEVIEKLVSILETECKYRSSKMLLKNAIELFVRECIEYLSIERNDIGNFELL